MPIAVPASLRSRSQELLTQRSGCAYSFVNVCPRVSRCRIGHIHLIYATVSVSSVFGTNILNLRQIGRKGPFLYTNIKIVLKIV